MGVEALTGLWRDGEMERWTNGLSSTWERKERQGAAEELQSVYCCMLLYIISILLNIVSIYDIP